MSYLDLPRVHFAGSFYFDPGTLNNATMNYSDYNGSEPEQWFPDLGNTRWNPNGDMQTYFANCKVTGVLDGDAAFHQDPSADPLIGARVDSQGPFGVIGHFPGAPTSAGKFSDYDPDQQYRSQINGMWLGVMIPGKDPYDFSAYTGFYGFLEPCNLRDLGIVWFQMRGNPAAGNYFSKIKVHAWVGDVSQSPLLSALEAACETEVAVRFTVDFFQGNKGVANDEFGYGRVQGNFAPVLAGDLTQLAPRRQLTAFSNQSGGDSAEVIVNAPKYPPTEDGSYARPISESVGKASASNPWQWYQQSPYAPYTMPAYAKVLETPSILTLDFGTILPQTRAADGRTLSVLRQFQLGYQNAANDFVALTNGSITIGDDDYTLFQSPQKTIDYLKQTGLFNIALTADEQTAIADRPLSLRVIDDGEGHLMRQEDFSGTYIDVDLPAIRMEQGETKTLPVLWSRFGKPVPDADPSSVLSLYEYDVRWNPNAEMPPGQTLYRYTWDITPGGDDGDIAFSLGHTNNQGIAELTITAPTGEMNLMGPRVGMLSRISFLLTVPRTPETKPPVGMWEQPRDAYAEPANGLEFFTALVWQAYQVPEQPTWDEDVRVLMPLLARLYPGMASKLNIGSEQTLIDNRGIFISYLSKTLNDPAYMPVTRELSAGRLEMLRKWLRSFDTKEA